MRSPPRAANRLLTTYVFVASALLHLVVLPLWVLVLDRRDDGQAEPLRAQCAEQVSAALATQRPCLNQPHCTAPSSDTIKVALVNEPEVEEPPEVGTLVSPPTEPFVEQVPEVETDHESTVDTAVEEEMVSRGRGQGGDAPGARQQAAPEAVRTAAAESATRDPLERRTPDIEAPSIEDRGDLRPDGVTPESPDTGDPQPDGQTPTLGDLVRDIEGERVAAVAGGGGAPGRPGDGSIDYLRDVQDGDRTLLNRRRVSYADFYERIKVGVAAHWSPIPLYRRRDPTGRIFGTEDRLTVLSVTLHSDGTLAKLYVDSASGVDFLDDEAMRAMRAAVPFPNPPEGLKDLDGQVHFRFAFHVDISTRKYRMFRYR